MDFGSYEEYLTSISNKVLSWQCYEKQIFIQLAFAKKDQGEKTDLNFNFLQAAELLIRV